MTGKAEIWRSRLFRVKKDVGMAEIVPGNFADLGVYETVDLHEWLAANPDILGSGSGLLVIQREHVAVREAAMRPDIVAMDKDGQIVVVEVKRDPAGSGIVWQAITYASFYGQYTPENVVTMYAAFAGIAAEDAQTVLMGHVNVDDISEINTGQRIVLVAPGFSPEVTTTALWLRGQGVDMRCVELVPYRDDQSGNTFITASVRVPLPQPADLVVRPRVGDGKGAGSLNRAVRRDDAVTRFMQECYAETLKQLPEEIRPDRHSAWAGVLPMGGGEMHRYFKIFASKAPWSNHNFNYAIWQVEQGGEDVGRAWVGLSVWIKGALDNGATEQQIKGTRTLCEQLGGKDGFEYKITPQGKSFDLGRWLSHEDSKEPLKVGEVLASLVKQLTPKIEEIA